MAIKKVCVVGSGTMGNEIVQVSARAGYETTMIDVKWWRLGIQEGK